MNTRFALVLFLIFAGFIFLCGFGNRSGGVLEIPRAGTDPRNPAGANDESSDVVPAGPDLRFHELLKFYGCWKATVTRRELTAFTDAAGGGPEGWTDKRYMICFARDLGGELQPTISQTQVGGDDIQDRGSSTELVGYDSKGISLVNRYTFVDNKAAQKAPRRHWFSFTRAPQPVEVQLVTNVNCLRDSLELICTGTATAECGDASCYSFSWTAKFHGS